MLHLRMKAHGENTLLVARVLTANQDVKEVIYPGWKGISGTTWHGGSSLHMRRSSSAPGRRGFRSAV